MKMIDVFVKSTLVLITGTLKCVEMKSEMGTYLLLYILGGSFLTDILPSLTVLDSRTLSFVAFMCM